MTKNQRAMALISHETTVLPDGVMNKIARRVAKRPGYLAHLKQLNADRGERWTKRLLKKMEEKAKREKAVKAGSPDVIDESRAVGL